MKVSLTMVIKHLFLLTISLSIIADFSFKDNIIMINGNFPQKNSHNFPHLF